MINRILLFCVRAYRWTLAPFLGGQCRFEPSCSNYAEEALKRKGTRRAAELILKRIGKCHPFHPGGFDPLE